MSIVITRALFCDHCANWYDPDDQLALAPDIRREATRHGWKRREGKDICPDEHDVPAAPQAPAQPTDDYNDDLIPGRHVPSSPSRAHAHGEVARG